MHLTHARARHLRAVCWPCLHPHASWHACHPMAGPSLNTLAAGTGTAGRVRPSAGRCRPAPVEVGTALGSLLHWAAPFPMRPWNSHAAQRNELLAAPTQSRRRREARPRRAALEGRRLTHEKERRPPPSWADGCRHRPPHIYIHIYASHIHPHTSTFMHTLP